jgi:hypothetical protein
MRFPWSKREDLDALERIISGETSEQEAAEFAVTIARSEKARRAIVPLEKAGRLVSVAGSDISPSEHLSNNELAECIAGDVSPIVKMRREAHLASCDECRAVFVRATAAYRVYAENVRPPFRRAIRGILLPLSLGIVPGIFFGIYLLGYFLSPFDPPWLAPLVNSPWIVVFGLASAVVAVMILLRKRW